ncbi:MAG: glycosyltransferase family 4 protein [bacterium]|nr:glycosyltransferase family 4 protein [bacterium]
MKILQVNKFLYPKGGAEIVCLGLAGQLQTAGHEVSFFGMADERNIPCLDQDCFPSNIDYHAERGIVQKVREALRTIHCREAGRGMARLLDRRRPDLIHMHNIYHQLTPSILRPARERGIPIIMTLHDYKLACPVYTFLRAGRPCEECLGGSPLPLLKHRCKDGSLAASAVLVAEALFHKLTRAYEDVTCFTSPSSFLREKMIAAGMSSERIIHLPNSLPFPQEAIARSYIAPPAKEKPILLWVGRMSHEKGLRTLLRAAGQVSVPFTLQLVGDGPQEAELRALASELELGQRVEFLGRRKREEIPDLILASSGTVLPSEWYENAPLSLLESLALGRPIIGSAMGGIPDMLQDGNTGWLFPAGDEDALVATLEEWGSSDTERDRRGALAWQDARLRFHPDTVLASTMQLYQRFTNR